MASEGGHTGIAKMLLERSTDSKAKHAAERLPKLPKRLFQKTDFSVAAFSDIYKVRYLYYLKEWGGGGGGGGLEGLKISGWTYTWI